MKLDWPDTRCILCRVEGHLTREGHLTVEHIIPEAIGGILQIKFLCKKCNDGLGRHVEAKLKKDPEIRLAIENLKDQIPWVYEQISQKQDFIGRSERGMVDVYPTNASSSGFQFRLRSSLGPDGVLVLPTDEAPKRLTEMLRKEGATDAEIDRALRKMDEAPENARVSVAPGFDIAKRIVARVEPKLDGRLLLTGLAPGGEEVLQGAGTTLLKIAFEYLALLLGPNIFDQIFDPIREALRNNDATLSRHRVKSVRGPKLEPFHGLLVERAPPHIVVQIRLFGELVYRVHFPHLRVSETFRRFKYTHDLRLGSEDFQEACGSVTLEPT